MADTPRVRDQDDDRRQARRRRGRHLHEHQPGDRGGARRGRRRVARRRCTAAIDAARRAFDETDWSTNRELRKRCLLQLHDAIEKEQEELREELILEVGCPRAITFGPQLDAPLEDALRYPGQADRRIPVGDRSSATRSYPSPGQNTSRKVWREPVGVVGAIVPWNFPFEVTIHKLGQALATGNTVVLKPAPNTPFNATRIGRLIAEQTDIPAGVVNVVTASDHFVGEELTLSPEGRPDLVHRFDRRRQADHGEGRGHDEAPVPRARRQVGDDRAGGRRPRASAA